MKVTSFSTKNELYDCVSQEIIAQIIAIQKKERSFNLGAATGSTMVNLYRNLHKKINKSNQKINYKLIQVFNLDEYYPMDKINKNSYYSYMNENFYKYFPQIPLENRHIQDSSIKDVESHCEKYDNLIKNNPIDIQLLGLGRNGHIGFNEPGSKIDSKTRVVNLHKTTREDACRFFENKIENVPQTAITVGIETILRAKQIFLIVTGNGKKDILNMLIDNDPTERIPATFLKTHPNVKCFTDISR